MQQPVVSVNNLGKIYWLYPSMGKRLLGCFVNPLRVGGHAYTALSGLTFDLYPGEAIALIGKNGAGKSTALQILAGITPPSEGSFQINGRVCALLELGSGFNPEFTGRQNIALAGSLLGLTHSQIREEEQNIIDFAEIGQFIDQPVKFYSSGMFVRLAFAVAVAGMPDLLIVDEALAVGDIFFRQKCYARLREMREKGMAVILVTHSSIDAQEFCDQAVLLENGRQTYTGDPKEAMAKYYMTTVCTHTSAGDFSDSQAATANAVDPEHNHPWPHLQNSFIEVDIAKQNIEIPGVHLVRYCITDADDVPCTTFTQGSIMRVYMEFRAASPIGFPGTGVTIWNDKGMPIYCTTSGLYDIHPYPCINAPATLYALHEVRLDIASAEYSLSFGLNCTHVDDFLTQRKVWMHEDWINNTRLIVNMRDAAIITVILPPSRRPARIIGFGIVNLPSGVTLHVRKDYHCGRISQDAQLLF